MLVSQCHKISKGIRVRLKHLYLPTENKRKHWIFSLYDKIQRISHIRGQCKVQFNVNNDDYCKLLIQIII